MTDEHGTEEQEGFGQASLGEAQSDSPALDPEMLDGEGEDNDDDREVGADPPIEADDPDSGPASTEDELDSGGARDQAEG